jgi:hypothetical protein
MELNFNGKVARMFSTVTSVATPHDVTLQDLHIEVFYPADAESESTLQEYEEQRGHYLAKPNPLGDARQLRVKGASQGRGNRLTPYPL